MNAVAVYYGKVNEDSDFSVLARVTSLDGSGSEYRPGEGNCLQAADINTITCAVYSLGTNRENESGTEVTPAPTVTVSSAIFSTLRTVGWELDRVGYNFRHDLAATYVPNPNEWYLVEYKITLSGGGVVWIKAKVKTNPVRT